MTSSVSHAQTADQSDVIVVTAQKRDQNALDVPVAISAVTAESLITQNLTSLKSMYDRIPGLQVAGERISQISIRGVTTGGQSNPTVAILVDDVPFGSSTYLGNSTVPDFDPAVLDRVEVLRGPQGTLYGASSLGGLIKYVTKSPTLNSFSGRVELGANKVEDGGYGHSVRGAVNIPLIDDVAALRVNGFLNQNPAWIDNVSTGSLQKDRNKSKYWGGRTALLIKPVEGLTLNFTALRQKNDTLGANSIYVTSIDDFTPTSGTDRTSDTGLGIGMRKTAMYTARGDLDLGVGTLTSISAWTRTDVSDVSDVSNIFSFFPYFYSDATSTYINNASSVRKFSQEVRLSGTGTQFDWLFGGFYTVEHSNAPQSLLLYDEAGDYLLTPYIAASPSSYREISGFGDLTWHATDRFDIQVGARYSHNKQVYDAISTIDSAIAGLFGESSSVRNRSSDNAFTWLVTPSYKITDDVMAYARVATGYRPGGPNPVVGTIPNTFKSDSVTSWEMGIKGQTSNRLLTYDVSLFQVDWKDPQLQSTDAGTNFTFYVNGSRARTRGVEAQIGLRPVRGLSIDATGTYTDATLRQALPISTDDTTYLIGATGDRLPSVPKYTATLSSQYSFDLSDALDGYFGGTVVYMGERLGGFVNDADATRASMPHYVTVDLRTGISIEKKWTLGIYIRNLTDKHGVQLLDNRNGQLTSPQLTLIQPRTIGFNISGSF
ncbi:MAG: TonB-dependent receptor [Sphingobium sp.]